MSDLKPVEVHTTRYFRCPTGCSQEFPVEHLFKDLESPGWKGHASTGGGPWYCDTCFIGWKVEVYRDGRVEVGPMVRMDGTTTTSRPTWVILEIPPLDVPIRLKVRGLLLDKVAIDREQEEHDRYHYEEHTCPTNYFRAVAEIEVNGDTDPHGLAKYIATYNSDAEITEKGDGKALEGTVPERLRLRPA